MTRNQGDERTLDANAGLVARIVVRRSDEFAVDVDLALPAGATVALLGPNGSGKSTTVEALAGILPLDDGRIELDGEVLDDPRAGVFVPIERRRIGVVFQQGLLFDHLDVTANVAFGPRAQGRSNTRAEAIARRWIDTLELSELAGRRPDELSGGQAQRVALARALAAEPRLLLMDEPLAALDVATRTRLRRTLGSHLDHYAGPRLLITHDPADAFLLADRILILEGGSITQEGAVEDVRRRPATPYVAALAGLNLLPGINDGGTVSLEPDRRHTLHSADRATTGPVLVTIHPNAIALHARRPHGSPRNVWPSSVVTVEPLGDIVRITLDDPLPVNVDVTPEATQALGLAPGVAVWASVKATEVVLNPA